MTNQWVLVIRSLVMIKKSPICKSALSGANTLSCRCPWMATMSKSGLDCFRYQEIPSRFWLWYDPLK